MADGSKTARRLILSYSTALASRNVNLASGMIALLNTGNAHAAPVVARALNETCGVSTYMQRNLVPLLVANRPERTKVMLFRLGLGSDPGTGWADLRPYRVSAFVKSLSQALDDHAGGGGTVIRRIYSGLSDFSHPNMSGTTLSVNLSDDAQPSWTLQPPVSDYIVTATVGGSRLALGVAGEAWDTVISTAQKHAVVLPEEDVFGPDDVVGVPEATQDS